MHQAQAFTVKSKGGPLRELHTDCMISPAFDPDTTPKDQQPAGVKFRALWDTGASHSAITQKVVDAGGLKPVGMSRVETAGGSKDCETFLVNIFLPHGVGFVEVKVSCVESRTEEVLIGMDIITIGDFSITNQDGNTTFSFRVPSLTSVDYVVETNNAKKKHQRKMERKRRGRRRR